MSAFQLNICAENVREKQNNQRQNVWTLNQLYFFYQEKFNMFVWWFSPCIHSFTCCVGDVINLFTACCAAQRNSRMQLAKDCHRRMLITMRCTTCYAVNSFAYAWIVDLAYSDSSCSNRMTNRVLTIGKYFLRKCILLTNVMETLLLWFRVWNVALEFSTYRRQPFHFARLNAISVPCVRMM